MRRSNIKQAEIIFDKYFTETSHNLSNIKQAEESLTSILQKQVSIYVSPNRKYTKKDQK